MAPGPAAPDGPHGPRRLGVPVWDEVVVVTLTDYLRARYDEDEAVARDWQHHPDKVEVHGGGTGYLAVCSPDRVLADVKVKRLVLDAHIGDGKGHRGTWHLCYDSMTYESECYTILVLATVYADRPDFLPEWREWLREYGPQVAT